MWKNESLDLTSRHQIDVMVRSLDYFAKHQANDEVAQTTIGGTGDLIVVHEVCLLDHGVIGPAARLLLRYYRWPLGPGGWTANVQGAWAEGPNGKLACSPL